jgi:hypothetical protein
MPTQLKIIVDENYTPNAPFTVNFAAPVIIKPGNKIALDKFTAVINGIASNFTLPNTTFEFYYGLNFPNFQGDTVTLQGQQYANVLTLLNNLTAGCNNTFTAYRTGYLPATTPPTLYRDIGLKVLCSATTNTATATTNTFQIQYATADLLTLGMESTNLTAQVGGGWAPSGPGPWKMTQSDNTQSFLSGGGCLARFQFDMPSEAEAQTNGSEWKIGLIDNTGAYHGISQNAIGEVFLINGTALTQVDIADFPVNVTGGVQHYCEIYQVAGQFALRYFREDGDNIEEQTEFFNSNTTNPGALGPFVYTNNYKFQAEGDSTDDVTPFPAVWVDGVFWTPDIPMDYANVQPAVSRTVGFNMSNSGSLRAGLDVPGGLNILTPINNPSGEFKCQSSINMAVVNSSFDIAIEILDLPLQTYQASTSRKPGQRNNVVAYFHPEFSQVGTGAYIYDSRSYQWLDIDITYPLNLSSLSFRVYDPDTGTGLDALSMSFNLLVSTEQY